ncbi:conjugal transfer protein [Sporosarcina luteola]|uniref:conjugal transfer protein n=1 Tax=Sporosarcina luteola TaxID=582850 RepID=UPI0020403EBE|nr:conjugal transfer protein [Sporosarcina luteola]MCM3638270.1 conjugal transfer protein [Sporosarcina luteola]
MRKRLNKSGTSKDGLLKTAIEIFKRANENEKRKKEIRIREKKSRPKGYRAKKLGAFTFWLLFSFMLLIVFVNVFSSNGLSNAVTEGDEAELNKATSAEGIEFAKSFLVTYFNWNVDNEKRSDRIGRLGRYLPDTLSEEAVTGGSKWNSTLTRESIVLKDIDNLGDSKALITFQVKVLFQSSADNNQTEDKAKSAPEKVKADKYIAVPVFYDEEENRFIVYDLPSFTFVEQEKIDRTIALETDGLKSVTDGSTQNIKAFLDTFFEAFSTDSKDKLTYLVEDPKHQNGLNQTMNFVRLKNTEIFEGKKAEEKVVRTEVILAEPDTGIEFTSSYLLVLAEKEGRYTVLYINNKSYIDELKNKKHEEEIEVTEGRELHKEDDPEEE